MVRPTKKAISKAQEASKALDRIFAEVDPNLIIAGFLGGSAAMGGLTPPFTRLLMTMPTSGAGLISGDYSKLFATIGVLGPMNIVGIVPSLFALYMGSNNPVAEASNYQQRDPGPAALFASGALEAMLMYKAFSTPGLLEAVVKAPAEMIKGVGAIVPG